MKATKGRIMGKKRQKPKRDNSPSGLFAARLRELMADRPAPELAETLGVTPDAVLKWLRGDRTPPLDQWPAIAKALGLSDWRDLLPPR